MLRNIGLDGPTGAAAPRAIPRLRVIDDGPPPTTPPPTHVFDLVVARGRVIDPETGFDDIADVGIDAGRIAAISRTRLKGRDRIDAHDRVVAPGFVDLLSYDPNPFGIWFKVADGVTTNLCMHGVNARAADWFRTYRALGSPCHYGAAFDAPWTRAGLELEPGDAADPPRLRQLATMAAEDVAGGYIGVDLEPEYTPGVQFAEVLALAKVAAARQVPCFFHGRYSDVLPPGTNADTLAEIIRAAKEGGCAVHVDHITSTGGTFSMDESLATLKSARLQGVDISACAYPYDLWAARLGSARFDAGWQQRFRIDYGDLQIAGTKGRLNATTFERYRRENKLAAAYAIPEADVRTAMAAPEVMVASDGILEPDTNNHPRGAGTFARTLGRYVRDKEVLSLGQALAKMTIAPVRRLERHAPALRRKGRLQEGADADVVVFDPERIADRATVADPARASVGVDWVVVSGQVVKDPGGLHRDRLPGRPVTYG